MAKSYNLGIYARLISQYIDYKRSLGFKMEDTDERLRRFDRLTMERNETEIGISKELFEEWSKPFPMESECNRYGRISILRGFSAYLQLVGYESYIPKMPKYHSTFTPHIYTQKEMECIFRECDKLLVHRHYIYSCKCIMPAVVRVLYGTGIRISEALKLKHKDADLIRGLLTLRDCKNGCDRVVPMSLSLTAVCKDYVAYKISQGTSTKPDSTFFTSPDGRSCQVGTVHENFRGILTRAGIPYGGRSKGPRLHDLRHTLCVNALLKMANALLHNAGSYDLYGAQKP